MKAAVDVAAGEQVDKKTKLEAFQSVRTDSEEGEEGGGVSRSEGEADESAALHLLEIQVLLFLHLLLLVAQGLIHW